jgi:RNA polymerase sigma-70 factor (ECF subfamily)
VDDTEAVQRPRREGSSGLAPLVRRYQTHPLRAAQLVTRDRGLAEDVVQAAFLRAYERIGQFDAGRPFGPWFPRSVVNAAGSGRSGALDGRHPACRQLQPTRNPSPRS